MRLTEAQRRNLEHVRDFDKAMPRSRAGYYCRVNGLSEFVWLFEDGSIETTSNQKPREGNLLVKVVGERITPAGRRALEER